MIRFLRSASIVFCIAAVLFYGIVSMRTSVQTDNQGPKMSMDATEITISTKDEMSAVLSGVSAEDEKDGDVTDTLVIESISNFVEKGSREATIVAFDKDGNITKTVRKVHYSDYISPRIILTGPLRVPVNNSSRLMDVITVEDCLDGDITENLQITTDETVSASMPGEYTMHLQAANSAGDVTDIPVTVEYYNYSEESRCPKILLSEYLVYTKVGQKLNASSYLKGFEIQGETYGFSEVNPQGLIKDDISVKDSVDYDVPGVYEVLYKVTDNDGNAGKVRLIVVVEA